MNYLETKKVPETYDKPFMWVSEYKDGTIINESDPGAVFTKLNKEQIKNLYLIGNGSSSHIDKTGSFYIEDIKLDFMLDNEKLTDIDEKYNDMIHYKGFYTDGIEMGTNGSLAAHTCSFHIGWKRKLNIDGMELFVKIIYSIIINKGCMLEMHFVPDMDKNCVLTLNVNNNGKINSQSIKLKLEKNKSLDFKINLSGKEEN